MNSKRVNYFMLGGLVLLGGLVFGAVVLGNYQLQKQNEKFIADHEQHPQDNKDHQYRKRSFCDRRRGYVEEDNAPRLFRW